MLPDAKDLHNMSLVGSYGSHLLHTFHPHLLQTLNHGMLAANGGPASYFASDRGLSKPSVLSNFQLPSAFSPPKYMSISLDQNLFNGNESFRTDSASPTCTSHESMEGSNDYDAEKGESPRSNHSDPRDLRHVHNNSAASSHPANTSSSSIGGNGKNQAITSLSSSASSLSSSSASSCASTASSIATSTSMAAAIAAIAASSVASTTTSAANAAVAASHLAAAAAHHHHQQQQQQQQQQQHQHQHHHQHHHLPPPPHPHHAHHSHAHHGSPHHPHPHAHLAHHSHSPHGHPGHGHHASSSILGLRSLTSGVVNAAAASNAAAAAAVAAAGGLTGIGAGGSNNGVGGHVLDICPVCGIKLTAEEWNSHFLTELDRLYKLSSGMERTNLQASYMFAPPCPAQENAIRTSHNRWETFQRIRNNRQNRLRIKIRKRKYGNELYFMENIFCSSCPMCKRKYALETGKLPPEDEQKMQEEIETVDVESCNDDVNVPDSVTSELHGNGPHMSLGSSNSTSSGNSSLATTAAGSGAHGLMHNTNNQPGKLDGILYRTACVINEKSTNSAHHDDEANATATSSSGLGCGSSNSNDASNWHGSSPTQSQSTQSQVVNNQVVHGHISVKNVSELSSTTHHFYNADSCGDEHRSIGGSGIGLLNQNCGKDLSMMDTSCNNDSDEDVIVDDDDSIKMANLCKKRAKYEDTIVVSSRSSENRSPLDERPRSEPQVTSTEPNMDLPSNNNNNINNNNNNNKYSVFDELRAKQQQHHDTDMGHNSVAVAVAASTTTTSASSNTSGLTSSTLSSSASSSSSSSATTPTTTTSTPPQQQQQLILPTGGLTQLDSKVGINLLENIKPNDDENKCFICKV